MDDNLTFQYIKLFLGYFSFWSVAFVIFVVATVKKPNILRSIPKYISSAKVGDIEVHLRQLEEKIEETEEQVSELEAENQRLNELYTNFDANAPVRDLEKTRQELKHVARNLDDMMPVLEGLKKGADPADVYAAAEILRAKRDPDTFDELIDAIDRIASDERLEGLRFRTVWTLASAAHKTVLSAVKHSERPGLSVEKLRRAKRALWKLHENPHVQEDRPDKPKRGIRGPASYALNWIEKGLSKYEKLQNG